MALSDLIVIGQYIPIDTFVHRMDPRIKLLISLIFLVFIFLINKMEPLLVMLLFVSIAAAFAKVPFLHLVRGLRPILFLIIITVIIQLFASTGEPLFHIWIITITKKGLIDAAFVIIRLIMLVMVSVILTFATSPLDLTFAMESFMMPLKKIGFPSSEIALMMSIALRFIPTLLEETDKIIKAQTSRGADFSTGGLISRAKAFIPVLIPLFVSAFRRAEELAEAMESRCFITGDVRGRLHVSKMTLSDVAVFIICMLLIAGIYAWSLS